MTREGSEDSAVHEGGKMMKRDVEIQYGCCWKCERKIKSGRLRLNTVFTVPPVSAACAM